MKQEITVNKIEDYEPQIGDSVTLADGTVVEWEDDRRHHFKPTFRAYVQALGKVEREIPLPTSGEYPEWRWLEDGEVVPPYYWYWHRGYWYHGNSMLTGRSYDPSCHVLIACPSPPVSSEPVALEKQEISDPEPPEGYRIATEEDRKGRKPDDVMFWHPDTRKWCPLSRLAKLVNNGWSEGLTYAVPLPAPEQDSNLEKQAVGVECVVAAFDFVRCPVIVLPQNSEFKSGDRVEVRKVEK